MADEYGMTRTSYPSDLTDEQWKFITSLIPKPLPGGRPRSVDMRQVINAILYINRSGSCNPPCLPHIQK